MARGISPRPSATRASGWKSTSTATSIAAIATAASSSRAARPTARIRARFPTSPLARAAEAPISDGMTASDPRSLLYRSGLLSPEEAQALARETLARCDDGELYLQFIASEAFGFDDGRLKTADYS